MESNNNSWWQMLPMIPSDKDDLGYKRLERIWRDNTRFTGNVEHKTRSHELLRMHHETHLTCTFFENFALFDSTKWIKAFLKASGLKLELTSPIKDLSWSYEWERTLVIDEKRITRLCDIVISYITENNDVGVIVVESKALNKKPGEKDLNIDYYLSIPEFSKYKPNVYLVYCIDERVKEWVDNRRPFESGIISWQELASLQISLANSLEIDTKLRDFIAGSIQYQFINHGIRPSVLCSEYLESEPTMIDIDVAEKPYRQTAEERKKALWDVLSNVS